VKGAAESMGGPLTAAAGQMQRVFSPLNIVTTAVWESETAFEHAKKAAAAEFQKAGFNPHEIMKKLRVEFKRAVYARSPY
jgi:hypothetical protein